MLCCQSGSEDSTTGLASHFNVIDRAVLKKLSLAQLDPKVPTVINIPPIRVVAVWQATEADFDTDFEADFRALLPPREADNQLFSTSFRFLRDKPRQRFTVDLTLPLFDVVPGLIVVESRIRRGTDADWLTQSYTIDVVVIDQGADDGTQSEEG
jgi:hypothetical protein